MSAPVQVQGVGAHYEAFGLYTRDLGQGSFESERDGWEWDIGAAKKTFPHYSVMGELVVEPANLLHLSDKRMVHEQGCNRLPCAFG